MTEREIVILATGGTIACTTAADGSLIPTQTAADLIEQATALRSAAPAPQFRLRAEDYSRLDSSSLTVEQLDGLLAHIADLVSQEQVAGVIICHGTDSLVDTAIAVHLFHDSSTPVLLSGAQRPFDHPDPDGPHNINEAIAEIARGYRGVGISFGGTIIPAWGAQKRHTEQLAAFSGEPGAQAPAAVPLPRTALAGTKVAIIAAWAGASSWAIDAAMAQGYQGLVIEALGSGNMSEDMGQALRRALAAGLSVVISTRVPHGSVRLAYGGAGGGASLAAHGALGAGPLRATQARMVLLAALATGTDPRALFPQS